MRGERRFRRIAEKKTIEKYWEKHAGGMDALTNLRYVVNWLADMQSKIQKFKSNNLKTTEEFRVTLLIYSVFKWRWLKKEDFLIEMNIDVAVK